MGETERITDMVDLLEEVDAQKARDLRDNVVPGDCIVRCAMSVLPCVSLAAACPHLLVHALAPPQSKPWRVPP